MHLPDVADHSDYPDARMLRPDWITGPDVLPRQRLIDDDDARCARIVTRRERAAAAHRDAHRLEVARCDVAEPDLKQGRRRWRALHVEAVRGGVPPPILERQDLDEACCADARHLGHAI